MLEGNWRQFQFGRSVVSQVSSDLLCYSLCHGCTVERCECRRTWDRDCRARRTDEGLERDHTATVGHMNKHWRVTVCKHCAVQCSAYNSVLHETSTLSSQSPPRCPCTKTVEQMKISTTVVALSMFYLRTMHVVVSSVKFTAVLELQAVSGGPSWRAIASLENFLRAPSGRAQICLGGPSGESIKAVQVSSNWQLVVALMAWAMFTAKFYQYNNNKLIIHTFMYRRMVVTSFVVVTVYVTNVGTKQNLICLW